MSDVNSRITGIVGDSDVVLFMKGTPLFPQCGFSSRAIAILDHCGFPRGGRPGTGNGPLKFPRTFAYWVKMSLPSGRVGGLDDRLHA